MPSVVDYGEVVAAIDEYYNTSSAQVWDIINQYNLTPAQLAELVPNGPVLAKDGVYKIVANDGSVRAYVNSASVNLGSGNAAQSIINSNAQTGTAAVTEKVQFAGNSVIDQNGKIVTSPNVTKYTSGVAGTTKAVLGSVVGGVAAAATGISLGKKIDSALYNANPTFWDSIGMSSLNPETWASITSDMSDTGVEGAFKTAFNFLFRIDPNGNKTQAYMPKDAYEYLAYVLAQAGMFDTGDIESSLPVNTSVSSDGYTANQITLAQPIPLNKGSVSLIIRWSATETREYKYTVVSGDPNLIIYHSTASGGAYSVLAVSTSPFTVRTTVTKVEAGTVVSTYTWSPTVGRIAINGVGRDIYSEFDPPLGANVYVGSVGDITDGTQSIYSNILPQLKALGSYGNIESHSIPGVDNQPNATVPNGIDSSSTQQQVADAIAQQYPDLHNNRIEQSVVQPDGTTKTIIYYPVPLPNATTDTTMTEDEDITTDQPVKVILPDGISITLPDGSVITGDGVTPITLPPGTYVLPTGTTITNNYITNITEDEGGTQASTEVTDSSTETLLQTIINILTSPRPQTATDTEIDTDMPTDNPADTGDGNTPPVVVPTGSASALWSVYNPSLSEINSFGAWLWSSNFIDQLLKMFNDPMQAIIGLHKTFIPPITGSRQNIQVGYLDSGVSSLTIPTQYSTVDCGSVQLPEYFGNVFDYDPYTKVYIYLPFIGFKELDVSQVMRSTIGVKYHGDAYTGACLAEISVTRDAGAGGVLYSFAGDCAVRYPLSQGSYMGIVNAIASLAVGAVSVAAGAGGLGMVGALGMAQRARTSVERSGAFDGNSGAMGIKKPYLIVMRPQTAMPSNYKHYSGQPSSSKITIGSTSGLIRVRECHVDSIPYATREEKDMIDKALRDGILVG